MRGPWSLAHLRGFFDGSATQYRFEDVTAQLNWLCDTLDRVLDSDTLNSDELQDWAISASRKQFGSNGQNGGRSC